MIPLAICRLTISGFTVRPQSTAHTTRWTRGLPSSPTETSATSAATPPRGCFSGYLKDAAATETAWRGGWFHTGDMVWRAPDGMLHFVDRKKNIIRRSGENIAAAEVEAMLLTHADVQQAAVMAVKDDLREEDELHRQAWECAVRQG